MPENSNISTRYFIVNPTAGGGSVGKEWPEIEHRLQQRSITFEAHLTTQPAEATELVRQAVQQGYRQFIAVGGDGTNHEIVNGLIDEHDTIPDDVSLGFFPAGSGNDFLRFLSVPADLDSAIERLSNYVEKQVDIGKIICNKGNTRKKEYYISVAGTGFTADVTKTANDHFKFLGRMCYAAALFPTLLTFRNIKSTITIDDRTFDRRSCMTVVAITAYFGGGMKIAPQASNDDGLLDVLLFREFSIPELLFNFPKVFKGTHTDHPKVESYTGQSIKIESEVPQYLLADGEIIGQTPAQFFCLPGLLKVRI